MYDEWMRRNGGNGQGNGESGPNNGGQGSGKRPDADETVDSGFKADKSQSQLQAGKILLQWKTKEISDPGQAKEAYAKQLREVKQGVSEAITQEQVPPGYHEAIKNYFDSIAPSTTQPTTQPSAQPPAQK